jgi:hypothetical protein
MTDPAAWFLLIILERPQAIAIDSRLRFETSEACEIEAKKIRNGIDGSGSWITPHTFCIYTETAHD